MAVIDKKISAADQETKALEKAYYKGGDGQSACKDFMEDYIEKRKAFHKYQILKVCVNRTA